MSVMLASEGIVLIVLAGSNLATLVTLMREEKRIKMEKDKEKAKGKNTNTSIFSQLA